MISPSLQKIAHVEVKVAAPVRIGETAAGLRRVVPIIGGIIEGENLNGEILSAGADYQVIRQDGYSYLDARYVARLDNGYLLYIVNEGVRCGDPKVMDKITRGEVVDPQQIYFRTAPRFETESPAHQWMMRSLFVCAGERDPNAVIMDFYQVL